MVNLDKLDKLTKELAEEIGTSKNGMVSNLLYLIFDKLKSMCMIIDNKDRVVYLNPPMKKYMKKHNLDINIGDEYYKCWCKTKPDDKSPHNMSLKTREMIVTNYKSPKTGNILNVTTIPLIYNGVSGTINIIINYGDE